MSVIWTEKGVFNKVSYTSESDLESAILEIQNDLFGRNRIYLDVKKRIGGKGRQNIPDGYLIDLSGRTPRLHVVEVEMAEHDPLRHVAVQILQFSLSFEAEPRTVKSILFNALQSQPDAKSTCERYAAEHDYRNLDHLLEWMVFEGPFAALVIIDSMPEELESVLLRKFQFGVEVLEVTRYQLSSGERMYLFEPFLADVTQDITATSGPTGEVKPSVGEINTIVVPAREDGFQEVFIGENRWYAIRIHGTMIPQIKYIAAYRTAPISAITHIAPVKSIEPWEATRKFVVNFSEPAREIEPISLVKRGRVKGPQNPRYTTKERLEAAKTLNDLW